MPTVLQEVLQRSRHLTLLAAPIAKLGGDILGHVTDPASHDIESDDAGGIGARDRRPGRACSAARSRASYA
jgi:hypothetical protein